MQNYSYQDTSNDESIARAIAEADQEIAEREERNRTNNSNEPSNNVSSGGFAGGSSYPGLLRGTYGEERAPRLRGQIDGGFNESVYSQSSTSTPQPTTGAFIPNASDLLPMLSRRVRARLCHVPCVIGDHVCCEMMVDTGAEMSVISHDLAKELNLANQIDRREWGIAAGVGQARILGKIPNVICTLGDVDFAMEFKVLDVPGRMLLLGMDQMRKYNCIIDLQRDVIVFGGNGGVEVKMLTPPSEPIRQPNYDSCVMS